MIGYLEGLDAERAIAWRAADSFALRESLEHAGGLNLGLLMRTRFRVGTPRGLQDRGAALLVTLWSLIWHPKMACTTMWNAIRTFDGID